MPLRRHAPCFLLVLSLGLPVAPLAACSDDDGGVASLPPLPVPDGGARDATGDDGAAEAETGPR